MSTSGTSNITSAFIDLATYDALEQFMYGGQKAISYFVRFHTKATWFSHIPTKLSNTGTAAFGSTSWSSSVSRAGDYLLYSWLRLTIPAVALDPVKANCDLTGVHGPADLYRINPTDGARRVRWTRNFMHNLIKEALLNFNDITAARLDNFFLDFWSAYTLPAGKRDGYYAMIGNIDALINPCNVATPPLSMRAKLNTEGTGSLPIAPPPGLVLPSMVLNLPLPFFYARDTGVALPTAALPYNDMKIQFNFRNLNELLIVDDLVTGCSRPFQMSDMDPGYISGASLTNVEVWCDYAIVSNYERKQMGLKPRDILIEQVQTSSTQSYLATNKTNNFDIRFSHALKALFFGLQNTTNTSEWSNYSAASPVNVAAGINTGAITGASAVNFTPPACVDPIYSTAIKYENSVRQDLSSDYYSLIMPYYHALSIPTGDKVGYHLFSYALDLVSVDPIGSTNFSKLTNVSFQFMTADVAAAAAQGSRTPGFNADSFAYGSGIAPLDGAVQQGYGRKQQFQVVIIGLNHNVIRISGGALGFPVL